MNLSGLIASIFLCATIGAHAEDFKLEPGYVSLFNGQDLTGWGYRTNNFDGKIPTDDWSSLGQR
ncbi:MAG: hypothetical protein JWO95_192 [Verrucomicrobiales bacterium]|nr:hypothetical protein [Verrucomicrobiales bacterium]